MLTRRQLRIKVMQAIFAFQKQEQPELKDLEKFLNQSMAQTSSKEYVMYLSEPETSIKKDLNFIVQIYTDIIAPSDEVMDFLEDENITWMDDYPLVNTAMIMFLRKVKPDKDVKLPPLVKDEDDIKFSMDLFRKTVLNQDEYLERGLM